MPPKRKSPDSGSTETTVREDEYEQDDQDDIVEGTPKLPNKSAPLTVDTILVNKDGTYSRREGDPTENLDPHLKAEADAKAAAEAEAKAKEAAESKAGGIRRKCKTCKRKSRKCKTCKCKTCKRKTCKKRYRNKRTHNKRTCRRRWKKHGFKH